MVVTIDIYSLISDISIICTLAILALFVVGEKSKSCAIIQLVLSVVGLVLKIFELLIEQQTGKPFNSSIIAVVLWIVVVVIYSKRLERILNQTT